MILVVNWRIRPIFWVYQSILWTYKNGEPILLKLTEEQKQKLGTCFIVKHAIDTAELAPIKQPLRRTPIQFKKETE